jgi:diguanylate cyclase (GGDEF)-like protein
MDGNFGNNPKVIESYNLLQEIGVFDEIDRQNSRITALEDLLRQATEIFAKTSVDSLLQYVISCVSDNFIPGTMVFILQDRSGRVQIHGFKNLKPHEFSLDVESLSSFEDFLIKYPGTLSFELFEYKFEHPEISAKFRKFNPEILVPIVGLNGLYGIILVGPKILEGQYSESEIHYLDRLMHFTSITIQNNIHYLSAVTDSKTHLYNNSFFQKRLAEELEVASEYNQSIGLLVIDIDNFKSFNDTHGHLAGDAVIRTVASLLSANLRRGDIAARFGGEEFTVLLPLTTRQQTWHIAERLRKSIASTQTVIDNKKLDVQVSIGCSVVHPLNRVQAVEIMEQADAALYESKRNGRNRCTMYRPGLLVSATIIRELIEAG